MSYHFLPIFHVNANLYFSASSSENSQNLAPTMRRLRADLSALRTQLITATSDIDERLSELESVKSENAKLKYRIKTLLRSLDAAEKSS